jgi:quinol monooxygenase YgiN
MNDSENGPTRGPIDDGVEVEPVMVIMSFRTTDPGALLEILASYVVASRGQDGCRNIDLVASTTNDDRIVVVQKWDSAAAQRAHFDSQEMVAMAQAGTPLLSETPDIDLFDGVSMHDLA